MPAQKLYNRLLNGLVSADPNEVAQTIAYAIQEEIARGNVAGSTELVIFDAVVSKYGPLICCWMGMHDTEQLSATVVQAAKPLTPRRVKL